MSEHSPAPWQEIEDSNGDLWVRMDHAHKVHIGNLEDTCDVCHANARVIKVAPELLRLVGKALIYSETFTAIPESVAIEMRAVIAKAGGSK